MIRRIAAGGAAWTVFCYLILHAMNDTFGVILAMVLLLLYADRIGLWWGRTEGRRR